MQGSTIKIEKINGDDLSQDKNHTYDTPIYHKSLASRDAGGVVKQVNIPVERWHRQYSSLILGACVPFPAPGGPKNIVRLYVFVSKSQIM